MNRTQRQQRGRFSFYSKRLRGPRLVPRPRGDRDWLLRSSALAGGVLAAILVLPSGEVMAAGVCGSGDTFTCTGGVDTNQFNLTAGGNINGQLGPGGNSYQNEYDGSTSPAFNIDLDGYGGSLTIYDGSGIDHTGPDFTGGGLRITNGGNTLSVTIGQNAGDNEAFVKGGLGVYIQSSSSVSLTNYGHIEGTNDSGIYITGANADVHNHSYMSVMGTDGITFFQEKSVSYDNGGGLTAGLNGYGINVYGGVSGVGTTPFSGPLVDIYNGDGGVTIGTAGGIYIDSVNGGGGLASGVKIDNSGNGTDKAGGLIFGSNGNGVTVVNVDAMNDGEGNVFIDNSYTYNQGFGVDPNDLDPAVVTKFGDWLSYITQTNGDDSYLSAGIIGYYNGVYSSGINGQVGIDNTYGLIVGLYGDGVNINNIGGTPNEDGSWQAVDINNTNGLIWGGEDGVDIYNAFGNTHIDNTSGTIFATGEYGAAISIIDTTDTHGVDGMGQAFVHIENAGGTIESWSRNAIQVQGIYSYSEDGYWPGYVQNGVVKIDNGEWTGSGDFNPSTDNYTNGGLILGGYSAIVVGPNKEDGNWEEGIPRQLLVNNGTGGAILGSGSWGEIGYFDFTDVAPVIDVSTNGYMTDGWANTTIVNNGVLSTWQIPHFQWDSEDGTYAEDYYTDNLSLAQRPDSSIDLLAIATDMTNLSDFVWNGGRAGNIDALSDYTGAAQSLLVANGTAFGNGSEDSGAVAMYNSGLMTGNLQLGGRTYNAAFSYDNEGEYYGHSYVQNRGIWLVTNAVGEDGQSVDMPYAGTYIGNPDNYDFTGDGFLDNAGLIQTAFRADTAEFTSIAGLQSVGNGGYYDEQADGGDGAWVTQNGLISMIDGGAGDYTYFGTHDFYGSEPGGPVTSYIGVDVNLASNGSGGMSDYLQIAGSAYGSTGIIIHQTDVTASGLTPWDYVIPVVSVGEDGNDPSNGTCGETACKEGDTFFISDKSDGYINVNGYGAVQKGFFAWYLAEFSGIAPPPGYANINSPSEGATFALVSLPAPTTVQMPGLVTGAQTIFYDTSGVVADHIYGNHFPATGSGGADLPIDGSTPSGGGGKDSGLWAKISGSWFDTSTSVQQSLGGPTTTIDTSFNQNTWSVLGGGDFSPTGERNGWRFGLYGGYTQSNLSFDNYGATADYKGGVVGGYAAYTQGGFYADTEVVGNFLDMTYKNAAIADVSANANSIGILGNTGYRFDSAWGFYEPIASFAYANTSVDNVSSGGGTVDFSNGQSIRAGAGGRIGTTFGTPGGTKTELALTGKLWNEFESANKITVTDSFGNSETFSDNISGLFGEIEASATVYSAARDWSGFVSGGAKFNSDFTSWDAKAGIRKTF